MFNCIGSGSVRTKEYGGNSLGNLRGRPMIFFERGCGMVLQINKAWSDDQALEVDDRFSTSRSHGANVRYFSIANPDVAHKSRLESPVDDRAIHQQEVLGPSDVRTDKSDYYEQNFFHRRNARIIAHIILLPV